jgi:hypothetical protein
MWKSAGRAPSWRVLPWHLPYKWGKKHGKTSLRLRKKPQSEYSIEPNEKSSIQEGDGFDCWIKNHSYIIFILFL